MTAPLIGPVDIGKYLAAGQIEQVICGGRTMTVPDCAAMNG